MTIEEQLEAMTNSRNALVASNDQLYKENQKALADHAKAIAELKTEHEKALNKLENDLLQRLATIATLQATIESLEQYRPYNPRWLDGEAFYSRVSKEDMVTLLTSDNPQLVTVGKTIELYRKNHVEWPVILDSTDFQQLVGYVLQSGVFDADEVTEIMRDATREEAYRVPE